MSKEINGRFCSEIIDHSDTCIDICLTMLKPNNAYQPLSFDKSGFLI